MPFTQEDKDKLARQMAEEARKKLLVDEFFQRQGITNQHSDIVVIAKHSLLDLLEAYKTEGFVKMNPEAAVVDFDAAQIGHS